MSTKNKITINQPFSNIHLLDIQLKELLGRTILFLLSYPLPKNVNKLQMLVPSSHSESGLDLLHRPSLESQTGKTITNKVEKDRAIPSWEVKQDQQF